MLSIVIPSYNEEANISRTTSCILEVVNKNKIPCELIFVNDGSKDRMYELIEQETQKHDN